uniref:Uncharacterized protein n=1 Tax=Yersinia enterocolitica TaxID=630 RepID=B0RKX2_YEREN|nr:hypothetical protein [Yersinia enterocolitica]
MSQQLDQGYPTMRQERINQRMTQCVCSRRFLMYQSVISTYWMMALRSLFSIFITHPNNIYL